jgi:hypothetical protein
MLELKSIDDFEHFLQDQLKYKLLYSQHCLLYPEATDACIASGVGSGKTLLLSMKAAQLSYFNPGNEGLMGRDTATNLEATTKADFLALVGEIGLIENAKSGKENYVDLKTQEIGKTSRVYFRHFLEVRPGSKHLSGMNLGFVCCDQIEDIDKTQWDYLETRMRRASVPVHVKFGIANTKGHDWVYKDYFEQAIKAGDIKTTLRPGKLGNPVEVREYFNRDEKGELIRYGIQAPTEENIWLPDGYIERILRTQTREYIERYLYASFEEWGGKIYKEYGEDTAHNIHSFPIPPDWPTVVSIDVGGDSPWAILVNRIDPVSGDVFVTAEFYRPTVLVDDIMAWLRDSQQSHIPEPSNFNKTRYVCDPENKPVVLDFWRRGLMCEAARKGPKVPGILGVAGYMHPQAGRLKIIPAQPQPDGTLRAIEVENAPHLWVFKDRCPNFVREHCDWQWKRDVKTNLATNKPIDEEDHTCDALIYAIRVQPPVEELPDVKEEYERLRLIHYESYLEAKRVQTMKRGPEEQGAVGNEMLRGDIGDSDHYAEETEQKPW